MSYISMQTMMNWKGSYKSNGIWMTLKIVVSLVNGKNDSVHTTVWVFYSNVLKVFRQTVLCIKQQQMHEMLPRV